MIHPVSCSKNNILGVQFDLVAYEDVMKMIQHWRINRQSHYITLANPFSVTRCLRDSAMRKALNNAGMTLPDGVGIVFAARLLGYRNNGRTSGPALMLKVCDWGRQYGYRHYFYGGADGIADRLAGRLKEMYPGLEIAGTYCPPFRPLSKEQEKQIIDRINSAGPDIVWVGLGAPKQEKWMATNGRRIAATALIGVGAAFDFHSGNAKWAPQWIQHHGFEGIYYLLFRPRRTFPKLFSTSLFTALVLGLSLKRKLAKRMSISAG